MLTAIAAANLLLVQYSNCKPEVIRQKRGLSVYSLLVELKQWL
jgi:hypothetical protein